MSIKSKKNHTTIINASVCMFFPLISVIAERIWLKFGLVVPLSHTYITHTYRYLSYYMNGFCPIAGETAGAANFYNISIQNLQNDSTASNSDSELGIFWKEIKLLPITKCIFVYIYCTLLSFFIFFLIQNKKYTYILIIQQLYIILYHFK